MGAKTNKGGDAPTASWSDAEGDGVAFNLALAKTLAHPLRQRILLALNDRVASPSELARELGEPLPKVSYHVRVLLDNEAVELVETKMEGPSVQHFYRATARPVIDDEHWAQLPLGVRRSLFDHTLQQTWEHLVAASGEAGFDDPRTHLTWSNLDLDEAGYQDMADLLTETLERALAIQAAAANRIGSAESTAIEHRTELAIQYFHRADGPPA
jgi:DNA-binding transcriptional ArsR family regulator